MDRIEGTINKTKIEECTNEECNPSLLGFLDAKRLEGCGGTLLIVARVQSIYNHKLIPRQPHNQT